jgi:hypothetical protein
MVKTTIASLLASLALCTSVAAAERPHGAGDRGSGLQVTPDGARTLISKDVGAERWAITRNPDGSVTGNIFFTDGRPPVFVFCEEVGLTPTEVMLSCESADRCPSAPCSPDAWTFVADVTLPLSFFAPPEVTLPSGPLGRRRFSIDPASSGLQVVSNFGPDGAPGFTGWLELEGSAVDPATGQARIDVVDASPLIVLDSSTSTGPVVICIEPLPDQFPVIGAGAIDCNGGTAFGYTLSYDHNVGLVGAGGFTEEQCMQEGGVVEDAPHAGVCNSGPVVGTSTEDTGPGGLIVAEIPGLGNPGFLVRITTETSLPCGDEGPPAFEGPLPLSTGTIVTTLVETDNVPGATLRGETTGSNFSCATFAEEDGPGTLTLSSVTYDLEPAGLGGLTVDIITTFVFDD